MLPHSLINFETQKNYQNETRFNGVYSRINIPKLKESDIYNKSWWVQINKNLLNSFVYEWW